MLVLALASSACASTIPRGMAVGTEAEAPAEHTIVVAYPPSACAGSGVAFVDVRGTFLGAVAPGQAMRLAVPPGAKHVVAFSIVDVNAEPGMLFGRHPIDTSTEAVLLTPYRWDTKHCGNGWHAEVHEATRAELDAALSDAKIVWLVPRQAEGQAWLEEHRARVDEMLARRKR